MTVLDELAEEARRRVERSRKEVPIEELKRRCSEMPPRGFPFEDALRKEACPSYARSRRLRRRKE